MATSRSTPSHVARGDIRDDQRFSMVRYIDDFHDFLDTRQVAALRLSGHARTFPCEQLGWEHDTAVGAWKERWWH